MVPMRMIHTSDGENSAEIAERGLEARKPSEHNWPEYDNQPRGVYVRPHGAEVWRPWGRNVCWEVDVLGLPMVEDEVLGAGSAMIVTCDVPPERLRYLGDAARVDGEVERYVSVEQRERRKRAAARNAVAVLDSSTEARQTRNDTVIVQLNEGETLEARFGREELVPF